MKKTIAAILCFLMLVIIFPTNIKADMGPKPSVVIDFSGLEGKSYYVTLLSYEESTGPYSANNDYYDYLGDQDIFVKFSQYKDVDGHYFLGYYENCSATNKFAWTYYPPQKFKILIYLTESDSFIVSDQIERYAFDSYYTAIITDYEGELSAQVGIDIVKSYDYTNEIISLVIRVILTITIELVIAWLFGFRGKKVLGFIAITNIATQILLNLVLNTTNYYSGMDTFIIFYVLLEVFVIALEAMLYSKFLKKLAPDQKLVLYAFSSNLISFGLGMLLALWLPSIF